MIYSCCDPNRRNVLEKQSVYNGIDFLEVVDDPKDANSVRQHTLLVHFVHDLLPGQLVLANVRIDGGERIRNIEIVEVQEEGFLSLPGDPKVLSVQVQQPGDFSTYTLRLVDSNDDTKLPPNFDPILSSIDFSFKVACPSDFDCEQSRVCPPQPAAPVDISYLAKDYSSFRQLMLDRMAKIMPQWQERSPADLGIVLLELLAYLGDYLSYQQDAVATEAYLDTARRRTSVRRIVRLVAYPMLDGCNARTWVHFDARNDIHGQVVLTPRSTKSATKLLTKVVRQGVIIVNSTPALQEAISQGPQVFELAENVALFAEHNQISFYTWGSRQCCLPQGATQAWLRGNFPNLQPGNVLIFKEVKGPNTGVAEDADPKHRCAVRLTSVTFTSDPIGGLFDPVPNNNPVAVTAVEWSAEDALPFPVCISSLVISTLAGSEYVDDVSVVLGNNGLADDGNTFEDEPLDSVPAPNPALTLVSASADDPCNQVAPQPAPARYRPLLQQSPVTFADPYDSTASANAALATRALDALLPVIVLSAPGDADPWSPQRDLLSSHFDSKEFVVEVENDGSAYLRFGDGTFGERPVPGTDFHARYRVGNGVTGNIGPDSLHHLGSDDPAVVSDLSNPVVTAVSNPLPASGGLDPETIEAVRQRAPYAFRVQNRAVTEQDYGDMAQRCDSSLQRAVGTFRWTGSWHTVFIAADRKGGAAVDDTFRTGLKQCLERYRMAGHDLEVDTPVFVSLEIDMDVCVNPDYFASDVEEALLNVLSNRILPDGSQGAFYPDKFTFGQTVYLSPIYALVQSSAGVDSVRVTKFQRQGIDSDVARDAGKLELTRLEIARLDNDPNFPEHGVLKLNMLGGR
jgi:hypothetical protein